MQPPLELPIWERLYKIGTGASGVVFGVRNPKTQAVYALKVNISADRKQMLIREIDIHSKLTHPNIIQYITAFEIQHFGELNVIPQKTSGVFGATTDVALILELASEGDLFEYAKAYRFDFPVATIKKWSQELISALIYLKENRIVHRDIKLENVLLSKGSAKLTDFGLSAVVDDLKYTREYIGTQGYLSPEVVLALQYSYQSDVWALGVLICELMGVQRPFVGFPQQVIRRPDLQNNLVAQNAFQILAPLFIVDPHKRIPVERILQLPFFANERTDLELLNYVREQKKEFGEGTRAEFYLYLANKNPTAASMSLAEFNKLYDQLYQT